MVTLLARSNLRGVLDSTGHASFATALREQTHQDVAPIRVRPCNCNFVFIALTIETAQVGVTQTVENDLESNNTKTRDIELDERGTSMWAPDNKATAL